MVLRARSHWLMSLCLAAVLTIGAAAAHACTVFVMTDGRQVLFCNNEDYSNPNTQMWFVPAAEGKHGCVYVGFDDGWAQGGCNDVGLAYGWVAGYKAKWERPADAQIAAGNSCQRMLETCTTLDEAVAFYERHWEESFSYGKLIIADRSGKSALFGAEDNRLVISKMTCSHGIGHRFDLRGHEVADMLSDITTTSVPAAEDVLKAALQEGPNATKYSVIYDLKTCDFQLYRFPEQSEPIRMSLHEELKKGPHYYDIPVLAEQIKQPLRPLTELMKQY